MDCRTARLLLDLTRPGSDELDGEESQALENHLAICPDCSALAQSERRFHQRVGLAMRQVEPPPGLRSSVLLRLDRERGDYYQRQFVRSLRIAVGVAACLLIAFFIWKFRHPDRVSLNPDVERERVFEQQYAKPSKGKVEEWFQQERGVRIEAPDRFDYAFLVHYDLAPLGGKQVPLLHFIPSDRNLSARVYVVSDSEFDLDSLQDLFRSNSSGYTVEVWKPLGSHFAYLIIYTGEDLKPFLVNPDRPAT